MTELSTKAETLSSLQTRLKQAKILPQQFFTVQQWKNNPTSILKSAKSFFQNLPLIVRSSSLNEDTGSSSAAGAYKTLKDISHRQLSDAINEVIESYDDTKVLNQILLQPMLKDVVLSGAAFSHDPNNGSPYLIVNWYVGSDTSFVTGGQGGHIWRQAQCAPVDAPESISPVILLLKELDKIFKQTPLDIEFAISNHSKKNTLWLLQCRPLIIQFDCETGEEQRLRLQRIRDKVASGMHANPLLLGKKTIYGVMPDWNPAEIIGLRPKPLALSLYRELITDSIWAYQRHNYGYRNLRSYPLMPHFFGLPYIDVRISFNSFIPADLNETTAEKLVNYYIDCLEKEPSLHDKVEFEIVNSCYTLDLPEKLKKLSEKGFNTDEQLSIAKSLRKLTNGIIHRNHGLWKADAKKLETLQIRRTKIIASSADSIEKIYWLIEDCKRYGTLPFAGLARVGFVAIQMLKSLVHVGVFTNEDYNNFISGTQTIGGQLANDRIILNKAAFLEKYGHLRPGTYNISSYRYDEAPDAYFDWGGPTSQRNTPKPFTLKLSQMREVRRLLEEHNLAVDPLELMDFIQTGIELRETAKFHFSHNLSDSLSLMTEVGANFGFEKSDLEFVSYDLFKELHIGACDIKEAFRHNIEHGKKSYTETLKTILPALILKPDDVWAFETPRNHPNFITQKRASGPVKIHNNASDLSGAVVFIPSADPGFDWLFSLPIAGFVTAWGGPNSHMAIRAGELSIPAIIGAGEVFFEEWSSARKITIDCGAQRVELTS